MNNFGAQSADYSSFLFSVFRMRNSEGCHSVLNTGNWKNFVRAAPRAARVKRAAAPRVPERLTVCASLNE